MAGDAGVPKVTSVEQSPRGRVMDCAALLTIS
jgi:hypothetical protein